MKWNHLIRRSLIHYWRTHAAVVLGVAVAVAVLSGALLVGDSVRGSLRDLVLLRLGNTDQVVMSAGFFREQLADDIRDQVEDICPIIVGEGFVTSQAGGGRAGQVRVYGIDKRFFEFHGLSAIDTDDALLSPALAAELGAAAGDSILIRVQRPSDVPLESLHSRKEDLGSTIRVAVNAILPQSGIGEFSLETQQGRVRAVFLPLSLLQREMEVGRRVNTLLVATAAGADTAPLEAAVRSSARVEDFGLKINVLQGRDVLALDAEGGLIDDAIAAAAMEAAAELDLQAEPVLTYLANSLRIGEREIPYSLVTAMDSRAPVSSDPPPIVLNDWAAKNLNASAGDALTMDYYVWEDSGRLAERTMQFRVAGVTPLDTRDRDLAPVYPGISDSPTLDDWDPPFRIDLRRVRPADEAYWKEHRTTPKAFIPLSTGQQLWETRYGALTSIRMTPTNENFAARLLSKLDAFALGVTAAPVRAQGLEASRGATDFGEYFVYFSFFLVVSALLLAALFFRLSLEQRARQIGLLRALGYGPAAVRRLFVGEGLALSVLGAALGVMAGILYAGLLIAALRTWWIGAVGTTEITLHLSAFSLAAGFAGGIAAALVCIWATLRGMNSVSERRLLAEQITAEELPGTRRGRGVRTWTIVLAGFGAALLVAAAAEAIDPTAGFFGAGSALLAACFCYFVFRFGRPARETIERPDWRSVARLGLRNATYRPARSVTSLAMIATATFILISVDAFRKDDAVATDRRSGVGGYSLLVESLLPMVHDPNSTEGREILGLGNLDPVAIEPFRVRPGDDASCLNLYEPTNPRILAPRDSFIEEGRFAFRSSLAATDAERANPWLLLRRQESDGAVPVIADANSMTYVLHRSLGEDIVVTSGDRSIRLRLVAALDDSIFQGELLMSEANFLELFPEQAGFPFLLVETAAGNETEAAAAIEDALTDFGADAKSTTERLAEFHRVENTYLTTFQMLGGLGLLLGTVGLGAVLLRNVMERRRELALLRAVGYRQSHFFAMTIAENAMLLVSGLITGALCALLAIAPALLDRGGELPSAALLTLLGGVLAAGLVTSLLATILALRSPLLSALRAE